MQKRIAYRTNDMVVIGDGFIERYFCECNNLYGMERFGDICPHCNTSVRYHEDGALIVVTTKGQSTHKHHQTGFVYDGVQYHSFTQCCVEHNVDPNKVNRLSSYLNCTRQEAIDKYDDVLIETNGKFYFTVEEFYAEHHVDEDIINRVMYTFEATYDEALSFISNKFVFNNRIYHNARECCRCYNIDYNEVISIMNEPGYDEYLAMMKIIRDRGYYYIDIDGYCQSIKMNPLIAKQYIRHGWLPVTVMKHFNPLYVSGPIH